MAKVIGGMMGERFAKASYIPPPSLPPRSLYRPPPSAILLPFPFWYLWFASLCAASFSSLPLFVIYLAEVTVQRHLEALIEHRSHFDSRYAASCCA